tara:strand:+ start:516 stop:725 length:210 start_codon:yes stop_codon:yes gene_type:complete
VNETDYSQYLNDDNSLNTGKLWSDITAITGFYREGRRKDLYEAVNSWHYRHTMEIREQEREKSAVLGED